MSRYIGVIGTVSRFATAAAGLLASFIPEQSLESTKLAAVGIRRRSPNRGQRWVATGAVVGHSYHRQPPSKSAEGPRETMRKQVPIGRMVLDDCSRYPNPAGMVDVPKHLRPHIEPKSSSAWSRHG
jgi:hypothetical protein